jgi:hypothetical protein
MEMVVLFLSAFNFCAGLAFYPKKLAYIPNIGGGIVFFGIFLFLLATR